MKTTRVHDGRVPPCPRCDMHPMYAEDKLWKCFNCETTLAPQEQDPLWPWETDEEAEARYIKRIQKLIHNKT